ncbi:MAG: hypothetical protein N2053_04385, partial [Chitinispirillaceae bacterium]|nr:hypothetical protein [Chitinispirillaceae bacterium]
MIFILTSFLIAIFLALNMGASGFSVSFTPSYGSGIVKIRKATLLYALFLTIGAILVGSRVVTTLQKKLILSQVSEYSGLIILLSA